MRRVLLIAAFLTATATLWAGYVIMPGPADGQLTDIGGGYKRWTAGGTAPTVPDPTLYWAFTNKVGYVIDQSTAQNDGWVTDPGTRSTNYDSAHGATPGSFDLDGLTAVITSEINLGVDGTNQRTFSIRVKNDILDYASSPPGVWWHGTEAANTFWLLYIDNATDTWRTYDGSNLDPTGVKITNLWTHIAWTYGLDEVATIYVDGIQYFQATRASLNTATSVLRLGRYGGGRYWDGLIDDMLVLDGCISSQEVYNLYLSNSIPATNKVLLYDFQAAYHRYVPDEGTNNVLLDQNYNTTAEPLWQTNYYDFDGSADWARATNQTLFDVSQVTAAAWARKDGAQSGANGIAGILMRNEATATNQSWGLYENGSTTGMAWAVSTSGIYTFAPATNNIGEWYFVVGTYNGTTSCLYVDGILKASTNTTQILTNAIGTGISVGRLQYSGNGFYWNGGISQPQIWLGTALTSNQVWTLYNTAANTARYGKPAP